MTPIIKEISAPEPENAKKPKPKSSSGKLEFLENLILEDYRLSLKFKRSTSQIEGGIEENGTYYEEINELIEQNFELQQTAYQLETEAFNGFTQNQIDFGHKIQSLFQRLSSKG